MILKREIGFFAIIIIFAFGVSLIAIQDGLGDPFTLIIRLLALNGYIAISIAAIMTPFLKEITLFFKKPFTKVHHYFAAAGLLLITLHPIAYAIQFSTLTVFLPNFTNLFWFFYYGGVVALTSVYLAFGAVLLRKKIVTYWRYFHELMYLALFVGVVHANLRGIDFQNIYLVFIFDGLFAAALIAFALKRWQFYRIRAGVHKNKLVSQSNNKGLK
jgi:predicted ferric reductase